MVSGLRGANTGHGALVQSKRGVHRVAVALPCHGKAAPLEDLSIGALSGSTSAKSS